MARAKKQEVVNLDAELETTEVLETFNEDDLPDPPIVSEPPRNYPLLRPIDGKTWYEKAIQYKNFYGHKVLPLDYKYTEDFIIVRRTQEEIDEINKANAHVYEEEE